MLTVSPLRSIAGAYLRLPAKQQALVYRLGLIIVVGLLAYVLVELAWQLVVSGGDCTKCSIGGDVASAVAATAAGSAAAAGSRDDSPKSNDWLGDRR
ncbi:MAG TPA: hypothetical protein VK831_03395, partial [Candidatus Deferrimicrobiaceae bacterium]|nr:hypothetical protein [Candidatus Deferrimicrobiaceae bacterium]